MSKGTTIDWPDGKEFAFTVFDDPDGQNLEVGRKVYRFLADQGFRTTKGVWPLGPTQPVEDTGATCADESYLTWLGQLQSLGFEIGFHNATCHTSLRRSTRRGLQRFRRLFGDWPRTMSNHYNNRESIYFGEYRLTGVNRLLYNILTRYKNRRRYLGHVEGQDVFWGDLCYERISYVRNFVFTDINTLAACPYMPYRDPDRPYVNNWFASSEGNQASSFVKQISLDRQERLVKSGGACIMYTHFGHGFVENGTLNRHFRRLMARLADRNGWFVPVGKLLDYIREHRGQHVLTPAQRRKMELRWLWQKVLTGTR